VIQAANLLISSFDIRYTWRDRDRDHFLHVPPVGRVAGPLAFVGLQTPTGAAVGAFGITGAFVVGFAVVVAGKRMHHF
jgi:hypothetical protein